MHLPGGDDQHDRAGRGGQGLHEREVDRDVALRAQPGHPERLAQPAEPVPVGLLAAERLRHPQPGHVLREVGVDRGHLFPRFGVRLGRLGPEHQRGHHQHREDAQHRQAEPQVDDEQRGEHAEAGEHRTDHGDEPGLQERGQRVHVRGHPGHDPAGKLALVEVQAEPLELGEELDPQGVQEPFAVPPDHHRLGDVDQPVGQHDGQPDERDHHDRVEDLGLDPVVDAVPDQRGQRQRGHRVEAVQDQPDDQRDGERPQQPAQREVPVPGPRLGQVHVRRVLGRRQRVDLGEQFGGGRQAFEHPGDVPGAPGPAASHWSGRPATRRARRARRPAAGPGGARAGQRPRVQHVFHRVDRRAQAPKGRTMCAPAGLVILGAGDELPVQRAALVQFLVGAAVGDPALIQDHDPVGQVQRRPAVRDDQRGAAPHDLPQRGVDLGLQARVDGRGRVVEQQQPGIGDQRPGQRHPLPLAAGESKALLADHGVVALGQPGDELVRLGRLGRGDDLLVGRVRPAVGDVGPDRVGEQEAVLHDQADRGAQRVAGHVGDVVPADADRAGLRVVEAGQQQGQGGLARAGRADHGDRLARLDAERKAAQHRLGRHVAEPDVVEAEAGRVRRELDRVRLVADGGPRVDDVEHPDDAGPRLLPDGDHHREHAHRAAHQSQVGREREECAQRDRALNGQPAAQREHADHAQRRDGGQRGVVPGRQPDHAQPGREQVLARLFQPLLLLLLLAETLDHAHAADGLVDDAGHVARLLLRMPARGEQLAPRRERDHPQRRRDRHGHDRQQRREHHHDADGQHEQHEAAERDRHHGQDGLHHVQV